MLIVVLMYAALAASFTVAKTVLSYAKPFFTIGARMMTAGTLFLMFQYLTDRKKFFIKKEDILAFLKVTLFYIYLSFIPEFWALQFLGSAKVTILYSITPFLAAGFAYFLVSERITRQKFLGMAIGVCGMMPILMTQDNGYAEIAQISLPELVLLVAIVSGAYGWFPIKRLMNKGYTLPMINGITMFVGGFWALLTSFYFEGMTISPVSSWGPFIFWLFALIVLSNGIFYNLYGWLLRSYSFTILSFAGFLTPIFGSFFGWFFLGEKISWHYWAALVLVSLGLFVFYREELRQRS